MPGGAPAQGWPRPQLPDGYVRNAQLTYDTVSSVNVGVTGEDSCARSGDNARDLVFSGVFALDITVSGAGGLQTGSSEAADTWYSVNVIGDSSGTNAVDCLLIPDGTAFSESGYDKIRRIGWMRNDASSDFVKFMQDGTGTDREYRYTGDLFFALNGGNATGFTTVALAAFLPPSSKKGIFQYAFDNVGGAAANLFRLRPLGGTASTPPTSYRPGIVLTTSASFFGTLQTDVNQNIEYRVTDGVNNDLDIIVDGFVDEV